MTAFESTNCRIPTIIVPSVSTTWIFIFVFWEYKPNQTYEELKIAFERLTRSEYPPHFLNWIETSNTNQTVFLVSSNKADDVMDEMS